MDPKMEKVPLVEQTSSFVNPSYTSESVKEEYPQFERHCEDGQQQEFSLYHSPNFTKNPAPAPATKKAAILDRDVVVKNPETVQTKSLLEDLRSRFTKNYWKWRRRATIFKFANLSVTVLLIAIQLSQLTILQVPWIDLSVKMAITSVFPAVTAAVLAVQQKLKWSEKAVKSKKSATLCKKLRNHAEYRLDLLKAGADLDDPHEVVKLFNASMHSECNDMPAFLMTY